MTKPKLRQKSKAVASVEAATQDALSQHYATEIGQKVRVERHSITNDQYTSQLREVLTDIAKDLQTKGEVPKGMEHIASFSVHVYYSSILQTMSFATVNEPGRATFNVAQSACAELFGTVCDQYGVRRQKRRSGASG